MPKPKVTTTKNTKIINITKTKKGKKRRRNKRTKNMPIARVTKFTKPRYRMTKSKSNQQFVEMEGEDLIIPVPEFSPNAGGGIFLSIPSNPLYWKGTRIAGIAKVYQQYRPIKFTVEYVPQVPVTYAGQVIYGTLWNNGVPTENLQQSLVTSNGGGMTTCYQRAFSHVKCNKSTLPMQYYNVHDIITEPTAMPFMWHAYYSGATADSAKIPGYVLLKWKYVFNIGLGDTERKCIVYNTTDSATALRLTQNNIAISPGWGVILSILKVVGTEILRKVAIVILEDVLARLKPSSNARGEPEGEEVKIGAGTVMSYDIASSQDLTAESVCRNEESDYIIPDGTRVAIYMNGSTVRQTVAKDYVYFAVDSTKVIDENHNEIEPTSYKETSSGPRSAFTVTYKSSTNTYMVQYLTYLNEEGDYELFQLNPGIQASSNPAYIVNYDVIDNEASVASSALELPFSMTGHSALVRLYERIPTEEYQSGDSIWNITSYVNNVIKKLPLTPNANTMFP